MPLPYAKKASRQGPSRSCTYRLEIISPRSRCEINANTDAPGTPGQYRKPLLLSRCWRSRNWEIRKWRMAAPFLYLRVSSDALDPQREEPQRHGNAFPNLVIPRHRRSTPVSLQDGKPLPILVMTVNNLVASERWAPLRVSRPVTLAVRATEATDGQDDAEKWRLPSPGFATLF